MKNALRLLLAVVCISLATLPSNTSDAYNQALLAVTTNGVTNFYYTELENGVLSFHTNNAELDALNDNHFISSPERFAVFAAHEWGVRAGSALEVEYLGNTTRPCNDITDGTNTIGARALNPRFNAQHYRVWDNNGVTVESDICMNNTKNWSVVGSRFQRLDFRELVAHELGHAVGLDHTEGSVMRASTDPVETYVGLWGDDKQASRDIYGLADIQGYARDYNPFSGNWSSAYPIGSYGTNLPIAGVVGLDGGSSWRVFRARVPTNRGSIAVSEAAYNLSSGSTWISPRYLYPGTVDYEMSMMAHSTTDFGSILFPVQNTFRGCNGVKQLRNYDDWVNGTIYTSTFSDICTNFGVSVDHDPSSNRLVMVYVASGEGTGGQDQGKIYVRTGSVGSYSTFGTETATPNYYSASTPKVACLSTGSCVLSYSNGNSNSQYDRQVEFTIDSSGTAVFGTPYTSSNWTYDSMRPFLSSTSEKSNVILNFTSSLGDGFHQLYSRHDNSWPVNSGSYNYIPSRSRLPASTVSHSSRNYNGMFFLP